MTADIKKLERKPRPVKFKTDAGIIETLESLLNSAHKGRVSSLFCVATLQGPDSGDGVTYDLFTRGDDQLHLLGCIEALKHRLLKGLAQERYE